MTFRIWQCCDHPKGTPGVTGLPCATTNNGRLAGYQRYIDSGATMTTKKTVLLIVGILKPMVTNFEKAASTT